MSWLAQVRHVLAKDVREQWRWLVAYAVVLLLALGRSVGWELFAGQGWSLLIMLVVVLGAFTVASAVLADSPTRGDAFWAAHPLRPSAVAATKLGLAALLVAMGMAAQALAARAFDVPWVGMGRLLAGTVPAYGSWLLAAALVAALVRDLRSFALAAILLPLGTIISLQVFASREAEAWPPPWLPTAIAALCAGAALVLLVWLYRARDTRVGTRLVGFIVAAWPILTAGVPARPEPREGRATATPPLLGLAIPSTGIQVEGGEVYVDLRVGPPPPARRFSLADGTLLLRLRDGSDLRVRLANRRETLASMEVVPQPALPGVRWRETSPPSGSTRRLSARLTSAQRRAIEAGVSSVTLEGRLDETETRVVATLPLVTGYTLIRDGVRLRVDEWTHEFAEPAITLHRTVVGRHAEQWAPPDWYWGAGVGAALLNPARREAVILRRRASTNGMDALVVPGASVRWERVNLAGQLGERRLTPTPAAGQPRSVVPMPAAPVGVDEGWLQGAQLLVLTDYYVGSKPLRLEARVP